MKALLKHEAAPGLWVDDVAEHVANDMNQYQPLEERNTGETRPEQHAAACF
jgi:hypothetical protein